MSPSKQVAASSSTAAAAETTSKRIVVIASLTFSLVNFRIELLKAMVAAGHDVIALAPDEDADAIATLTRTGVAFRRIPMARTGINPFVDIVTAVAIVRQFRELRPDLVLAYTMKPIIYGGIAGRLTGVRQRFALFTGFGYLFGSDGRSFWVNAVRRLSIGLYRSALVGSKAVFVYNDADAEEIRRHRLIGASTLVIPVAGSGVDLDRFAVSVPQAETPIFLLVARLLREKGIADYVASARVLKAQFPHARFQILGPFDPSPGGITRAQLEGWTADGAVEYLGETRDVRPYLAASTVFVLPSVSREGMPRSSLEAMAVGRAIVTTDTPGCRDTVVDGFNGFRVPRRDVAALSDAMRAFLIDDTLAIRMGARSRELVEERFDVHAVNRALLTALGLGSPDQAETRPGIAS